jgi:hypothetical protein
MHKVQLLHLWLLCFAFNSSAACSNAPAGQEVTLVTEFGKLAGSSRLCCHAPRPVVRQYCLYAAKHTAGAGHGVRHSCPAAWL